MMTKWMAILVLGLLGAAAVQTPARAQAATAPAQTAIPRELDGWQAWVLDGQEFLRCPLLANTLGANQSERICAWPGRLALELEQSGGRFTQSWVADIRHLAAFARRCRELAARGHGQRHRGRGRRARRHAADSRRARQRQRGRRLRVGQGTGIAGHPQPNRVGGPDGRGPPPRASGTRRRRRVAGPAACGSGRAAIEPASVPFAERWHARDLGDAAGPAGGRRGATGGAAGGATAGFHSDVDRRRASGAYRCERSLERASAPRQLDHHRDRPRGSRPPADRGAGRSRRVAETRGMGVCRRR